MSRGSSISNSRQISSAQKILATPIQKKEVVEELSNKKTVSRNSMPMTMFKDDNNSFVKKLLKGVKTFESSSSNSSKFSRGSKGSDEKEVDGEDLEESQFDKILDRRSNSDNDSIL